MSSQIKSSSGGLPKWMLPAGRGVGPQPTPATSSGLQEPWSPYLRFCMKLLLPIGTLLAPSKSSSDIFSGKPSLKSLCFNCHSICQTMCVTSTCLLSQAVSCLKVGTVSYLVMYQARGHM